MYSRINVTLTIKNTGFGFNELKELMIAAKSGKLELFNSIYPTPKGLLGEDSLDPLSQYMDSLRDINKTELEESIDDLEEIDMQSIEIGRKHAEIEALKRNAHSWRINNWGTPSEAFNIHIQHINEYEFVARFDVIISPPWKILIAITERFPQLTLAIEFSSFENDYFAAGGYAPDMPIQLDCQAPFFGPYSSVLPINPISLSDQFIEFGKRFSKFPITCLIKSPNGGCIESSSL